MSKGSLFWANASGKLGQTVFYRAKGEQRNRTYIKKIYNPKTTPQMENRVTMNNLVAGFKALKPVLSKSMVTKKSNESDYNAFIRLSKSKNSPANTKEGIEYGYVLPYGFKVSDGSLVFNNGISFSETFAPSLNGILDLGLTSGISQDDLRAIYDNYEASREITGGMLYKLMVGSGNVGILPSRFKINIVTGVFEEDNGCFMDVFQVEVYEGSTDIPTRIINNSDKPYSLLIAPAISHDGENSPYVLESVGLIDQSNWNAYAGTDKKGFFAGIFISATVNGKLDVSPSTMRCMDGNTNTLITPFLKGGSIFNAAVKELGDNAEGVLATE